MYCRSARRADGGVPPSSRESAGRLEQYSDFGRVCLVESPSLRESLGDILGLCAG
jgi:hypothetical protein